MRGFANARILCTALLVGLLWSVGSSDLEAQSRSGPRELDAPQFGIGFIANAPDMMTGGGAYVVLPKWGGIGIFVDAKFDYQNPSDSEEFEPGLTADRVPFEVDGANFIEHESSYRSFNVGLIRPINPFLMVYGGAGLAKRTRYSEYEEPSREYGRGGIFWVEAPSEAEDRLNMMIGLMMRMGPRITSHFGFETQPRGITVGFSLRLPSW